MPENENETADVVIIGAGASGAAVAWRLAQAGMSVVCLEQGGWVDPATYPAHFDDWELRGIREFSPNPNIRARREDYPVNDGDSPLDTLMYNAVGGSTIVWTGHFPRFHPSDFRLRSLDGVADDWPISYDDLAPYYELNDRMMGVSGIAGDPANPPREPRQTPPLPLGRAGETLVEGFESLDWHWWPADAGLNTRPYGEGREACNNCGPCRTGCTRKAKSSVDVTYWPAAVAAGAILRTGARVYEITVDSMGRADGALYIDASGARRRQRGRAVVIACNGVGTPRLLLLSKSKRFPDGLANGSGLVGKNLMHHPAALVMGRFDEALDGHKGSNTLTFFSHEFYETDPRRDFVRGVQFMCQRSFGPMMTALGPWEPTVPWGAGHHDRFLEMFGHTSTIAISTDDLPDPENCVTLDPDLCDSDGLAAPAMHYRVDDNSRKALDFGMARAREVLAATRARETFEVGLVKQAGFHLMGTARMGDDRKKSVVDRWGRAHDVGNLFIVDGSVFVTGASVNPTSTIQALALRTADHIIATRASARTPD